MSSEKAIELNSSILSFKVGPNLKLIGMKAASISSEYDILLPILEMFIPADSSAGIHDQLSSLW